MLSAVSGEVAEQIRTKKSGADAKIWSASAERMSALATELDERGVDAVDEGDDDPATSDDEDADTMEATHDEATAPVQRKERRVRRLVAGMFEVNARAESCRLREVTEAGTRGEVLGRVNAKGIEVTEWPIAAMTTEHLQKLTRGRGGAYMFEWFGRDNHGARVSLGRSRTFKMHGEPTEIARRVEAAEPARAGDVLEQVLVWQRYQDDRADRERERNDRIRRDELELQKHRETLASKERIAQMEAQARIVEARTEVTGEDRDDDAESPLDPDELAAIVARAVDARLAASKGESDDLGLPRWLQALGVNRAVLESMQPVAATVIPLLLQKIAPGALMSPPIPGAPQGGAG
jgi:hypothetical protein